MADLAGVDLLNLIGTDTRLRRVASTHGGEYAGPCPFCGGRDRFRVWPEHPSGRGRWWCRQCGRSGDAVDYLRERDGLSYQEALERLRLPQSKPERPRPVPSPTPPAADTGGPTWPPGAAEKALAACEAALWSEAGARARAWLAARGLREETLRAWRIGYNPADRWLAGLYVPRGIVIPCFADGRIWYLKVRRPVPPLPGPKYQQVKGGRPALFGLDHLQGRRVVVICEGEFDALLLWQEAADIVDVVALGSATARPAPRFLSYLLGASRWLVATDRDEAGEKGAEWWADFSARVLRARPLQGNDLTDFYLAGGDLRAWVRFHLGRLEAEEAPHPTGDPFQEEAERLLAQAGTMDADTWARRWADLAKRAGWACYDGLDWDSWADPLVRRCVESLGAVVRRG